MAQAPQARSDPDAGGEPDAPPPARELPQLEPSGLQSSEVVTGGASPADELPLVIALHGAGEDPEGYAKLFESFGEKARVVVPQGPLELEKGRAWFPPSGPDAAITAAMKRSADAVAALADELRAKRPTRGKTVVTGVSQGGVLAFLAATRHPERVGAAVPVAAWLPQFAWPDEALFVRDGPVVRALNGATDELAEVPEVRRGIVKLRMLKLDATVRLYADTGHDVSPQMHADLFRMLRFLVADAAEPSPCAPCPGTSMDPESCSLCPEGEEAPVAGEKAATSTPAATTPALEEAKIAKSDGPDLALRTDRPTPSFRKGKGASSGLSREQIQQTFRRNMASIRFCHERELQTHPGLAGRVSIRFTVAPDGSVSSAQVASSTLGNDAVAECVRRAVTRARFPQIESGGAVTVTYPFSFAAMEQ